MLFKLQRIFVEQELLVGVVVSPKVEIVHYLVNVLRIRDGEQIRIFNERNGEFLAKCIVQSKKKACTIEILELICSSASKQYNLSLAQAIIKPHNLEVAISMAAQIGISDIYLINTDRSQSYSINETRMRKLLIEAIEQSENMLIPIIHQFKNIDMFLSKMSFEERRRKIFWAQERAEIEVSNNSSIEATTQSPLEVEFSKNYNKPFRQFVYDERVLGAYEAEDRSVLNVHEDLSIEATTQSPSEVEFSKRYVALIGPEGGWSDRETQLLAANDSCIAISLGDNILRSETAAISLLSILKYSYSKLS